MLYVYVFAIILHVASAAAWFGLGLRLPGLSRMIVDADKSVGEALATSGSAAVRLMDIFSVLMYGFALLAIVAGPGFAMLAPTYHLALGLGLALILVQVFMIRRNWGVFRTATVSGQAASARKKVVMSIGIGHLLWVALLVLMFWPRLIHS